MSPNTLPEAVRRILVWSDLGCTLVCEDGRWHLERPPGMTCSRGPAPKLIAEGTARAAIAASARVSVPDDMFGVAVMRVAA